MTVLITVWGASPGVGKSTLCAGLSPWLADARLRVDHFREEEILTRPQFTAVAEAFQATGTVELQTLITTTAKFVDSILAGDDDIVVTDALVPFVPSLLAMGHDEAAIDAFMDDLTETLAPVSPIMVFLDGSAETALPRAAKREEPGWLDWYIGKLAGYEVRPPVTDVESAARYLRRERAVTLDAVDRKGWRLVLIDHADELSPREVLHIAKQALTPWIRQPHQPHE